MLLVHALNQPASCKIAYARLHGNPPAFVCRKKAGTSASSGTSAVFAALGAGEAVPERSERLLSCDRARLAASELPTRPRGEAMFSHRLVMGVKALFRTGNEVRRTTTELLNSRAKAANILRSKHGLRMKTHHS